jgi:hypothetical protein
MVLHAAVRQWLQIREDNGIPFPASWSSLCADMDHSALLLRLQSGKDPLPEPPPRSYSYPWYDLVEMGMAEGNFEVFEHTFGALAPVVVINQMSWDILETITAAEEWILTYRIADTAKLKEMAAEAGHGLDVLLTKHRSDPHFSVPMKRAGSSWRLRALGILRLPPPPAIPERPEMREKIRQWSAALRRGWCLERLPPE